MRRNSTSIESCQHDDINIVTVSVVRRRWTAPLKLRRPCVKHFTTFYTLLKHVSCKGFFCALGTLFCALVRKEAIFAVCKRCANEGFACMCKEKWFSATSIFQNLIDVNRISLSAACRWSTWIYLYSEENESGLKIVRYMLFCASNDRGLIRYSHLGGCLVYHSG